VVPFWSLGTSRDSLGTSRDLRADRPSTGPLCRSAKAELVSGSSSALLGRRRRPFSLGAGGVVLWAGRVALGTGGVMLWTGWVAA